jgi:catechol 2,3-dioxygenase-like lactoylglutathione lyase family enzyme
VTPNPQEDIVTSTSTSSRVDQLATVIVPVGDQQAMIDFYVDKLGLEKRIDLPFGGQYRWVEVGPEGAETSIALAPPPPDQPESGNRQTGISLHTGDIEGYHARLKEAGVDVDAEISRMGDPVPPMFWLRDPEANTLMIVEVR